MKDKMGLQAIRRCLSHIFVYCLQQAGRSGHAKQISHEDRQRTQHPCFLKQTGTDLGRCGAHAGKNAELMHPIVHKYRKGVMNDQNQRNAGKNRHAAEQHQNHRSIRITGISHQIQGQQLVVINHVLGMEPDQFRNFRHFLIDVRRIFQPDVHNGVFSIRLLLIDFHAFHVTKAFQKRQLLFVNLPRKPGMKISFL